MPKVLVALMFSGSSLKYTEKPNPIKTENATKEISKALSNIQLGRRLLLNSAIILLLFINILIIRFINSRLFVTDPR
jgi:hypothetical protein